ncbi:hypothetical protein RHGRI_020170 [Rhododendron griersonianum]|uniref:Uncharacterized protein n=1 Tax=Rhododendron griersonianum TaxID=479676 RepID=A0AAV6JJM0_9ERIC|nr:hypothetical protein RHGRI_020170 [Rhododendron griersonianum]
MDGLGLRKYIVGREWPQERNAIKVELTGASTMVLGAMEGFYTVNSSKWCKDNILVI